MRPLTALAVAGFRRWSAYRAATVAGAVTNSVFGLLRAAITVAAVGAAGGTIAGYSALDVATYSWLAQAMIAPITLGAWKELADRVRTGDISVDLGRPVDLQLSWLAADLGRATFVLLPRALPPLAVGAVTTGLGLPTAGWSYLLGAVSVVLAVVISFGIRFVVNLSAFWLLDVRGVLTLQMVVSNVLCGFIIPVAWFPPWLGAIAAATPFPSMLQSPVDVLSGRVLGLDAAEVVAVQALWALAVLGAGRLVLSRATRRLVVQGG